MSYECISDSEEEESSHLVISPQLLENNLHTLSPNKRSTTRDRLRQYLQQNASVQEQLIEVNPPVSDISSSELPTVTMIPSHHSPQTTELDEDSHHLQTYINSRATSTRRGLRKRNFASTHPYLSDQAHYLGLCDISYLNELYDENNQDLDVIVKYLNYNYMKMKERYRGDEKYRHKNFYTILGRGLNSLRTEENQGETYHDTQVESQSETQWHKEQDSISGFMNDLFSDSDQDNYSQSEDSDLEPIPTHKHHSLVIEDDEEQSDSELSDSDALVRVGGRIRKEKSILRGALPESAKRLSIYKAPAYKRKTKSTPKQMDYRKGMAIRKSAPKHRSIPEFTGFVDDSITYDTSNELYHELYNQPEDEPILERLESDPPSMYDAVVLSESSSSDNESGDESDIFEYGHPDIDTHTDAIDLTNITDDEFGEVQERDSINMMLATGERRHGPNTKKKHRSTQSTLPTAYRPPTYGSSANTSSAHTSSAYGSSSTVRNATNNTSRKRLNSSHSSSTSTKTRKQNPQSYGRLQVKSISPATNQRKKHKSQKKNGIIDTYLSKNPKDLFANDYLFSRQPILSTTTIEAESETRFVKEPIHSGERNHNNNSLSKPLLNSIDLAKIIELAQGKSYTLAKDTVNITFLNETYTLSLVDIQRSTSTNERLLTQLAKTTKSFNVPLELFSQAVSECIKGLIEWALVLQRSFSTREWKLLDICYNSLVKSVVIPISFKLQHMPYFMLLYYTVSNIALFQGGSPVDLNDFIKRYAQSYWKLYFDRFSIYETFDEDESFTVHCMLVNRNLWWESIVSTLQNYDSPNSSTLLEPLFQLCSNTNNKGYSWVPVSILFDKHDNSTNIDFCYRYIETIYMLNQRKDWPIDEKVILQIYRSIAARKFANFTDEIEVPDLLGRVRTRYDIPDSSFFERFMQFLYWYVSGISHAQTVKKLITKLFISSKFQYVNDKTHRVMFINRLNFVVLLSQLSNSVDLGNQICGLFEAIEQPKDVELFKLGMSSLIVLCQVAVSTHSKLPIDAMVIFIKFCVHNFFTVSGTFRLWNRFIHLFKDKIVKNLNANQMIQVLGLSKGLHIDMPDLIWQDLLEMFAHICPVSTPVSQTCKVIQGLVDLLERVLHRQMGRIPLPSLQEETRVCTLIESCIANWIKFSALLPGTNWEKLVLQTFPYTGNHASREKFSIYFYFNVLQYHNLKGCQELVGRCVIRELMLYNPSKYLSSILKVLEREKWGLFALSNEIDVRYLIQHSRHIIVNNIIDNLSKSRMKSSEKLRYVNEIQKVVNSELDKYYSCNWYKEFCVRVVKCIQIQCQDFIDDATGKSLSSLSSKLGISQLELSQFKIHKMPILDKLRMFHIDFVNAVHFGRDVLEILDKFVMGGVDVLYHLMSVYLEAISARQYDKWKLVYELLKYFDTNYQECQG
ncbi:uncharacterized protein SPAPADRAFT_65695 [Spathaspora passalidarum NRRL Y-27907]|uniref:Uncharacterized protein n=1 Tax=Spathaspora passalidarum (strain NRRL Y-27907 / 11-Y1) TaxID=619300 RepID=G3AJB2_SPAPN|nr:uncharacterized protein SPAPADRAFT_65695 [Spathaspora passalidarum NRRL Y-27907]EGW34571.1 hypothetical protein SPAPADRAFT_65695 [Spathaspora passalidarum NRRL Y-27907]